MLRKKHFLPLALIALALIFPSCKTTDQDTDQNQYFTFTSLDLLLTNEYVKENNEEKEIETLNYLYDTYKSALSKWVKENNKDNLEVKVTVDDTNRKIKYQDFPLYSKDDITYFTDFTVRLAVENPYTITKDDQTYTENNTNVWALAKYENFKITEDKRELKNSEYAELENLLNQTNASLAAAIKNEILQNKNPEEKSEIPEK